jgi:cytochrome c-type protein NapC
MTIKPKKNTAPTKRTHVKKFSILKWIGFAFIFMVLGVLSAVGFDAAVGYTNTVAFCTSCHSQQHPFDELKKSTHWLNRTGVHAGCPDCHVPHDFFPKMYAKVMAYKDVYHELMGTIDTKEKFEARRWEMANRVWATMQATNSRECRRCHSWDHMDLSAQDRFARKKHEKAADRNETCIDCHKGIVHQAPEEPVATTEAKPDTAQPTELTDKNTTPPTPDSPNTRQ